LRDLQRTLAVIGNKLSSRDKLPQLLRGTGMKSLAAMAKEEFGELLVEHPTFADLFDEARFQADIESIMSDLRNGTSNTIPAETIAGRVAALQRERARREMIEEKEARMRDEEWDDDY
jgi:hypothetical protein